MNIFKYMCFPSAKVLVRTCLLFFTLCNFSHKENNYCEAQLIPSLLSSVLPVGLARAQNSEGLQFTQREVLNGLTGSTLEWVVEGHQNNNSTITFNYTTSSTNVNEDSVLFLGLSNSGQVEGADIAVVTFGGNGSSWERPYLVDMHGINNDTVLADIEQNWNLVSIHRNNSHVSLVMSRLLDTCDDQDLRITNNLVRIIWGSGSIRASTTGNGSLNISPEGQTPAYLTDPTVAAPEDEEVQTWRLSRRLQLPARRTSYWCTIHRAPQLSQKHHIIGFAPYFRDELSRRSVHHQMLHRCFTPPGVDPSLIFEKYLSHPGEECYLEDTHELPVSFCTEMAHVWGVGGKPFVLPEDVGFSIGETRNEYYMFEAHYDNPESRSDLVVENGVDLNYSPQLRANEGSLIYVGTGLQGLHQFPPGANNFTIAGHCSSECTKRMFPSGAEIVATFLHSHEIGRQITLKHFRGNSELPWIQNDHNYAFDYQQMRLLQNPVTILPGDHLATECVYNTSLRNTSTLSGFSTLDEMCMTFMVLNKRIRFGYCSSEYPTDRTMARYGITNMTWSREDQERIVNAANNPDFVGLPVSRVMDQVDGTSWTLERIRELEREQLYEEHEGSCPQLQYIMATGYALLVGDGVTGGLIPGQEVVEYFTPSTRSIRTSLLPIRTTRYSNISTAYVPPRECPILV